METEGSQREAFDAEHVSLANLMSHIVKKHHTYCRDELARLEPLMNSVVRKHSERHRELRRIQSLFTKMGNDLNQHLLKEEQTLFPIIARMEEAQSKGAVLPRLPFGTIANPIRMMLLEHETGDKELDEIRKLSSEYKTPVDGDAEYEALLRGLQNFEEDMKQHVFLENDRLFPRAIALEQGAASAASTS